MSKFNVGDTIRIMRGSELMPHRFAGRTATVERFDAEDNTYRVRLSSGTFWWAHERDLSSYVTAANRAAEAARTGNTPHEFKPGDAGFTKAGESFSVLAVNPDPTATYPPIVRRGPTLDEYKKDGRCCLFKSSEHDLVAPKKEVTTYVNIYADGSSYGYTSDGDARLAASAHAVAVALPVTAAIPC